ncbi:glycoside hydrolase family 43 protein [Carboxylicivirga linearis]|uniref:Glycoside hydrolase 43 family protein n=1 Tax=Carboxylicivirga linearis TaxID=1628157 RepID=A0ABS5JSF2_9BACT|nr:glycoside hydrolase 43 family protein [Carboxylicivirga linearis]MBS2097813.1 glycoside hydrolase 43 family protein [Carboxylicivirga linearis]
MKKILFLILLISSNLSAQHKDLIWKPDLGNGKYQNPIIYADYSDPDVVRVGDDYYMTSSSFSHFPGLPILHSKDLVNWTLIAHAAIEYPDDAFDKPQHGNGIWAPSFRYHNNEFYIYFGDPDRGVFMTKAKNAEGPWEPLKLIKKVTGWIDCCPLWDDDGKAYLVHAFANSRSGIKSILAVCPLNEEGTEVLETSTIVFNGQKDYPTIEGPKFYKRNGYYYIFAPAGGVKPGWQTVLRSKNIYGPYEDKIVLEQGSTNINGPHQGGWVTTQTGEDWFIHFQDRYAYGRVVHLNPMRWEEDWPVMGVDYDGNGIGEPVSEYTKPNVGNTYPVSIPQTSDEFESDQLGLQWQWNSNFDKNWYSLTEKTGSLRLYPEIITDSDNLWNIGRLLLQKTPTTDFSAVTKMTLEANTEGEQAGLLVFGMDYSYITIEKTDEGYLLKQVNCLNARKGKHEAVVQSIPYKYHSIYLKVDIYPENPDDIIPKVICKFSYSKNGKRYIPFGEDFIAKEGRWVGAKVGIFANANKETSGYADFDWFRIEK